MKILFNQDFFIASLMKRGYSLKDVAEKIGKNTATVYRKVKNNGSFTRNEIILISELISWNEINEIFFANKLA